MFVEDDPAERDVIRQILPEVEVIPLPPDPGRLRAGSLAVVALRGGVSRRPRISNGPGTTARGPRRRTSSRRRVRWRSSISSLEMAAVIAPFDEVNLSRIVQLIGKTNQFNITTRRQTLADVRWFMDDDRFLTLYLRLRDRFGDHGLVGILIAEQDDDAIAIDTWLMSCRVIGRTVEDAMFYELCQLAGQRGGRRIRGTFAPTREERTRQGSVPAPRLRAGIRARWLFA